MRELSADWIRRVMMSLNFLKIENREKIRIIYFNVPPVNALNLELVEELAGEVNQSKRNETPNFNDKKLIFM